MPIKAKVTNSAMTVGFCEHKDLISGHVGLIKLSGTKCSTYSFGALVRVIPVASVVADDETGAMGRWGPAVLPDLAQN